MKPFNAKATCSKCGAEPVAIHAGFHSRADISSHAICYHTEQEHIHRSCGRCHYEWLEAPLDKAQKGAA